jgi:hypothetical protein
MGGFVALQERFLSFRIARDVRLFKFMDRPRSRLFGIFCLAKILAFLSPDPCPTRPFSSSY